MKKHLLIALILLSFASPVHGATREEMIATLKFLQERVIILQYQLSLIQQQETAKVVQPAPVAKKPVDYFKTCGILINIGGKCYTAKEYLELRNIK